MTVSVDSLNWAIDFVAAHSDGDLFPKVLEMQAIQERRDEFISLVQATQLSKLAPGPQRRFLVPKDEISYRQATQLDPQDAIILSALVYQFGAGIEARRQPKDRVFSYRFSPSPQEGLYRQSSAWNNFWNSAAQQSANYEAVIHCDVADFYNQIYHHTVENQLAESNFPNQALKWIIELLKATTAGVSRGVPVGPHAIHLIAESTLIPIDNNLLTSGIQFVRYADDIIVFCKSADEARPVLQRIAEILDRQQRLMLQRHKTKVMSSKDFQSLAKEMIEDRPINRSEEQLLQIIRKYSHGNPYRTISYSEVSNQDWGQISEAVIAGVIEEYVNKKEVDYIRLRWFYRRLAQIGHPGAIRVSLSRIGQLGPCFSNICAYLASVQTIEPAQWREIGTQLLALLETEEVKSNEYYSLSILSLFARNEHLNHFTALAQIFRESPPSIRREILLAANSNRATDWLREHKEDFGAMDPWLKRAFVYCTARMPKDERVHFLNRERVERPFEATLSKWAKG